MECSKNGVNERAVYAFKRIMARAIDARLSTGILNDFL